MFTIEVKISIQRDEHRKEKSWVTRKRAAEFINFHEFLRNRFETEEQPLPTLPIDSKLAKFERSENRMWRRVLGFRTT